jgi:hypothetical protein
MKRLLMILLLLSIAGCQVAPVEEVFVEQSLDEKHHCESKDDCVDGEYCEVTEPGGCVNAEWWWENVGNKRDCMPAPNVCECIDNRCEKEGVRAE